MSKNRNYLLDNIKAILIFFVVLGHYIEPFINTSNGLKFLYVAIYSFHMPLFVFVSGSLLKLNKNKFKWGSIVVPLVISQIIFSLTGMLYSKVNPLFNLYWILWFLLTLLFWNVITPHFIKIKHHFIIAIVLAIVAVFFEYTRPVSLFPFFLIGYHFKESYLNIIKKYKYLFLIVTGAIFVLIFMNIDIINFKTFYYSLSYKTLGYSISIGLLVRIISYIISSIIGIALLTTMPNRKLCFSYIGENTLLVYLVHGIFAKYFAHIKLLQHTSIYIVLLLSIATTLIFSIKILNQGFKKFIKIIYDNKLIHLLQVKKI